MNVKKPENFYVAFRLIIGLVFLIHGITKVPGILEGSLSTLFVLAGIIEVFGGTFLILGLWVRPVALVGGIEMLVAFSYIHVGTGMNFNPLDNGGEAAVLFFAAFLVLYAYGSGKLSIDKAKKK